MTKSKVQFQILFGLHIKMLRNKKGLTQEALSVLIKKSKRSVQRLESGNANPDLFYINNLAVALNVKLSDLLNFEVKKEGRPIKKRK